MTADMATFSVALLLLQGSASTRIAGLKTTNAASPKGMCPGDFASTSFITAFRKGVRYRQRQIQTVVGIGAIGGIKSTDSMHSRGSLNLDGS